MLSAKDPPQNKRYTQTESKGMEKIFHAIENKKSWINNTYM